MQTSSTSGGPSASSDPCPPSGLDIHVYRNATVIERNGCFEGRLDGRRHAVFRIVAEWTQDGTPVRWREFATELWPDNPSDDNWSGAFRRMRQRLERYGIRNDLIAHRNGRYALNLRPGHDRITFEDREIL